MLRIIRLRLAGDSVTLIKDIQQSPYMYGTARYRCYSFVPFQGWVEYPEGGKYLVTLKLSGALVSFIRERFFNGRVQTILWLTDK